MYPLFLSDFNETDFFDRFSKNPQISNVMKIRQLGAELFDSDREGRTGRHNAANSHFLQFREHT
jgi:hypothetical protein